MGNSETQVWIVTRGIEHDTIGVHASLEGAKAAYPEKTWQEHRRTFGPSPVHVSSDIEESIDFLVIEPRLLRP